MTRRFAGTFAFLLTLTALMVAPVAAKEMAVAVKLETAIPPDVKPGDTIDVAFTMTVTTPDGEGPYDADPISLRVAGPTGAAVAFPAHRDRTGHYLATITVPSSGIARIAATLPSDGPEPLSWDLYAAPPVVGTAADPAATEATTAPVSDSLAWLVALGIAVAVIAAAAAVVIGRRRTGVGRTSPTRA
jgi:hypothetical protein